VTIEKIKEIAVPACREFRVKRLDLFGSLSRGRGTVINDVDLIVEFEDPAMFASKRFFGLLHHLEDKLKCRVDLLTFNGLKNPYFRRSILDERVNIYGR